MGGITKAAAALSAIIIIGASPAFPQTFLNQNTSAPLGTDSAGREGMSAVTSVFRVICPEQNSYGTGFLHKSGKIVTADHVVRQCKRVVVALPDNSLVETIILKEDRLHDLAIVAPLKQIVGKPLSISSLTEFTLGQQIAIWGFPAGYVGRAPMLSVGYFSGVDQVATEDGQWVGQMVLNAAVNHGDSGGPVVLIETGEVVGIADNKIVPLSPMAISALTALQKQPNGFMYNYTASDGTTKPISEGQVVAMVLEELRQQVQLVVGHAVFGGDLRSFLKANGIEP